MGVAWSFAFPMLLGGLACFVHGIFPFLFETTGSRCVKLLYTRIANRGRKVGRRRGPELGGVRRGDLIPLSGFLSAVIPGPVPGTPRSADT
jgi:hypothetical protein